MSSTLFKNVPSKVGDLVHDVMSGRIGLPDLQRPFVWKDTKVRELLDSMIKGYPIGYIMLWESPNDYETRKNGIGSNVKTYDEPWRESYKDFSLIKTNYVSGEMTPRLIKTNIGDIFTTNCLEVANTSGNATVETTETYEVGDQLGVSATGYLSKAAKAGGYTGPVFNIVKIYTMPDGQPGVKVQRIG